MTECKL